MQLELRTKITQESSSLVGSARDLNRILVRKLIARWWHIQFELKFHKKFHIRYLMQHMRSERKSHEKVHKTWATRGLELKLMRKSIKHGRYVELN